jgi:secreted PhoX family phosphatase
VKTIAIPKSDFLAKIEKYKSMMQWDSAGFANAKERDMIEGTGDKYVKQYLAGDHDGMTHLIEYTEDGPIEYVIEKESPTT